MNWRLFGGGLAVAWRWFVGYLAVVVILHRDIESRRDEPNYSMSMVLLRLLILLMLEHEHEVIQ